MFKSLKEKHAYKQGIKKGRKGGTVWKSKNKSKSKNKKNKKINPLDRYTFKNKRSGKKIFPQNRNRYFVENHFVDYIDDSHYVKSSYHSSLKDAKKEAAKREAEDRKMMDHRLTDVYSTISGPRKAKYKVKKRIKR